MAPVNLSAQADFNDPRLPRRFWDKVFPSDQGCWFWGSTKHSTGYGLFSVNGVERVAHRVAYEALVGPVPEHLECDHLCRVRICVNPLHIEPVTPAENRWRGVGAGPTNAKKTACKRGHTLPPYSGTGSVRACAACRKDYNVAYYQQRKAKEPFFWRVSP
jgi:hypothetical protein